MSGLPFGRCCEVGERGLLEVDGSCNSGCDWMWHIPLAVTQVIGEVFGVRARVPFVYHTRYSSAGCSFFIHLMLPGNKITRKQMKKLHHAQFFS